MPWSQQCSTRTLGTLPLTGRVPHFFAEPLRDGELVSEQRLVERFGLDAALAFGRRREAAREAGAEGQEVVLLGLGEGRREGGDELFFVAQLQRQSPDIEKQVFAGRGILLAGHQRDAVGGEFRELGQRLQFFHRNDFDPLRLEPLDHLLVEVLADRLELLIVAADQPDRDVRVGNDHRFKTTRRLGVFQLAD